MVCPRQAFYYDEEGFDWVPLPTSIFNLTLLRATTTHFSWVRTSLHFVYSLSRVVQLTQGDSPCLEWFTSPEAVHLV
jgi:hypothetical protein